MKQIIVTLGPASCSSASIRSLSRLTNFYRLNTSHNSISWHEKIIRKIKKIDKDSFILLDIPGIKARTNNKKSIKIKKGQKLIFSSNEQLNKENLIPLTRDLPKINKSAKYFSVDDGRYIFEIYKHTKDYLVGISRSDFTLLPKKGVNISQSVYDEVKQRKIYIDFLF